MAVEKGMKRLKEFDYLTELSETARQALDIPEDAEVVNITDKFREGGPIVVSYTRKTDAEQRTKNRADLQRAIDYAFDDIIARCEKDAEYFAALKARLGIVS
ncbi:MAG: hypothetical protein E7561_05210 [Ruminococcaceae bacterium]|nr:hypothetical protein [Oscillospiraceae bacterium]